MVSQTRQSLSPRAGGQRQGRFDAAARYGVELVAARLVGGWAAGLQERRFEQLVERGFGRLATGREQGGTVRRRREQRHGREELARGRPQPAHGGREHLTKDFAFGPREALAHALDRLTAAQLSDRPPGEQWVTGGR